MADDVSNLLHFCRSCGAHFHTRKAGRDHYLEEHTNAETDELRNKLSTDELDSRLVTQSPEWHEYDFDGWKEQVRKHAEGEQVDYRELADESGVPASFIVHELEEEGIEAVPKTGAYNTPSTWSEVTAGAQKAVLADVYFPNRSHVELADSEVVSRDHQSSISRAVRKYGWMLNYPGIDTPVSPCDSTSRNEGEISWEFDADSGPVAQTAESPTETAERAADVAEEILDTPDKSEEPDPSGPTPRVEGEKMAIHGPEEAFEVVAALIESDRYERAQSIVERIYERN